MRVEVETIESVDSFARNEVVVRGSLVDLAGIEYRSAQLSVSRQMLSTFSPGAIETLIDSTLDRLLFPWRYPDRPVGWAIEPFPTLTRLTGTLRRFWRAISRG